MHRDDFRSWHTVRRGGHARRAVGKHLFNFLIGALGALVVSGCSKSEAPAKTSGASAAPAASSGSVAAGAQRVGCPVTGGWTQCSVLYRLDRAGVGPRIDSTAKAEESALHAESFVVKIGQIAKLEVFLYPDSAARVVDAQKLDRTQLVNATAPQTIRRERTLIENGNLVALLTSLNEHQRERVSDALTAGAPQPTSSTP
jgi:hypothetical protein